MVHGTRGTYTNHGCRCAECRSAHNRYWQAWRAGRRLRSPLVDATECRQHVTFLRDHGWSYRELAEKAGIARSTVCRVAHGQYARVEARYVDKLLAVSLYDR